MSTLKTITTSQILDSVGAKGQTLFILYYRTNIMGTLFKIFSLPEGTGKADAYKRGQEHCKIMGYRFMNVVPLFSDISAEEAEHGEKQKAS